MNISGISSIRGAQPLIRCARQKLIALGLCFVFAIKLPVDPVASDCDNDTPFLERFDGSRSTELQARTTNENVEVAPIYIIAYIQRLLDQ